MGMPLLKQDIRYCTADDGLRLAYSTMGNGPPLIRTQHFFTHLDFEVSSPVWKPWLSELSRHHTVLRYDARGCGLSEQDDHPPTLETWIGDLETIVQASGWERFSIFGCSQGAAIAIAYAARHPEKVNALVVLGGFSRGLMHRNPTLEQVREFQLLQDMVLMGWGKENPAFRQAFTSIFIPDGSPAQIAWFNELQRVCTTPSYAVTMLEAVSRIDVSGLARQVRCPGLVLHARGDSRVPFEEGQRIAGLIPDAHFVPLESRNHVLLETEPAFSLCFETIRAFLQKHEPACGYSAFPTLTPGELALLDLLAHGLDNLQIAAHLNLSDKTVRNKVSVILDKIGVSTRSLAIVRAREAGLGTSPLAH